MKRYRHRWTFRALCLVLKLNPVWTTFIVSVLYAPFLFAGITVGLIAFVLALAVIMWLATIPQWKQTDDGTFYYMESDERAEWVFDNWRFPKL